MKVFRSIGVYLMTCVMLISAVGITVNMHLCSGQVQSIALIVKAEPCKAERKSCHGAKVQSMKKGCCEEETIVVKGKDTPAEVKAATQVSPSFNLISVILPVLYSIIDSGSFHATPAYAHYKPPLVERDINVLVHSFLI